MSRFAVIFGACSIQSGQMCIAAHDVKIIGRGMAYPEKWLAERPNATQATCPLRHFNRNNRSGDRRHCASRSSIRKRSLPEPDHGS